MDIVCRWPWLVAALHTQLKNVVKLKTQNSSSSITLTTDYSLTHSEFLIHIPPSRLRCVGRELAAARLVLSEAKRIVGLHQRVNLA